MKTALILPLILAATALAQQAIVAPAGVELSPAGAANAAQAAATAIPPDPRAFLFEGHLADFSEPAYTTAVASLFSAYERNTGRALKPGKLGKVALKLDTASGAGLATPAALVEAVALALEKRGFTRANIMLIDQQESRLRESGYLPPIRDGAAPVYKGMPVLALDSGKGFDPKPNSPWTYPNALPSKDIFPADDNWTLAPDKRDRVSQLPMPLMFGVDFWINLPTACDHPATGVSGALTNATLLAVGNAKRFADNPANAAKAAIEIASIPEMRDRWEFTILPLEKYQFLGGPKFDAAFTVSEKRIWLSANPVILDHLMWRRFNANRKKLGFAEIFPEPPMFNAANAGEVHLGSCRPGDLRLVDVGGPPAEPTAVVVPPAPLVP